MVNLEPAKEPIQLPFVWRVSLFLGHGRALEFYLGAVGFTWSVILLIPVNYTVESVVTYDTQPWHVAAPLLFASSCLLLSLYLSYKSLVCKWCRVIGAVGGILIWSWITVKAIILQTPAVMGFPFAFWAIFGFTRILLLSVLAILRPETVLEN